jgi:hypothetical protein
MIRWQVTLPRPGPRMAFRRDVVRYREGYRPPLGPWRAKGCMCAPEGCLPGCLVNSIYLHRGAPWEHDSSVANYRKQESLISQVMDFLTSDFRIWPHNGNFATEPHQVLRAAVTRVDLDGHGYPHRRTIRSPSSTWSLSPMLCALPSCRWRAAPSSWRAACAMVACLLVRHVTQGKRRRLKGQEGDETKALHGLISYRVVLIPGS